MGVGKQFNLPEIDDTRASGREEAFEAILERVKSAGGEIIRDEEGPLVTERGADVVERGRERVVEFNLNGLDFRLIRKVEEVKIVPDGNKVSFERLDTPRVNVAMQKKGEMEDIWQNVDLDDLF